MHVASTFPATAAGSRPGWLGRRLAQPRRWVLLLAALEGLAGAARLADPQRPAGPLLLLGAGITALGPAFGLILLYVNGRLLFWSGKALGGRAAPPALRAAIAWSGIPAAVGAIPALLHLTLTLALAERYAVPGWASFARDLAGAAARSHGPALLLAVASLWLQLSFVAEAQRFSRWRAALNDLLASLLGLLLVGAGVAVGWAASGSRGGLILLVSLALAAVSARAWLGLRARRAARQA